MAVGWDLNDPSQRAAAQAYATEIERINAEARRTVRAEPPRPGHVPELVSYSLTELHQHKFPHRRALLSRGDQAIIREGYLGEIYAMRGFGKTYLAHTLGIVAATGVSALGFHTDQPCRVLIVDGEMASEEIQQRIDMLLDKLHAPRTDRLSVVAADWQNEFLPRLDTPEGQQAIEPFVDRADLLILDNRSCLFDPEGEKDPSAWQPAQDWLLGLRRRGKAVQLVHHSNRQGGARGHSKPEDIMNVLINLTRPEDYTANQGARFIVEFDKSRGAFGAAVAPFIASLEADGWKVEPLEDDSNDNAIAKLIEYLVLAEGAGDPPKSANAAITKAHVGRNQGLAAWASLRKTGKLKQVDGGGFVYAGDF
jgi:putative DNA primase/helicase